MLNLLKTLKFGLLKAVSFLVVSLMLITASDSGNGSYGVIDEENIVTKFTVLSDCHVTGSGFDTLKIFSDILNDIKSCDYKNDVTVFLGDDTSTGDFFDCMTFYGTLRKMKLDTPFVNVCGNHDSGNDSGKYDVRFKRFMEFNKYYLDLETSAPYYYQIINNTYFIVLASEDDNCHDPIMTETQLKWFSETMEEASKTGNPIFVCSHHHYTAYEDTKSQLYKILGSYKNVFYLYGHTHKYLSNRTIRTEGKNNRFTVINVPKSTAEGTTIEKSYIGMQIEVYEDEVVIRPRNFKDGIFITDFEKRIPLVKD